MTENCLTSLQVEVSEEFLEQEARREVLLEQEARREVLLEQEARREELLPHML